MKVKAKVRKTTTSSVQSSPPLLIDEWTTYKVKLIHGKSAAEIYVNGRDPTEGNPDFVLEFGDNKLYIRARMDWNQGEEALFVRAQQFGCVVIQRAKDVINESQNLNLSGRVSSANRSLSAGKGKR